MTRIVQRGKSIDLYANFILSNNTPLDPSSLGTVSIYNENNNLITSGLIPQKEQDGIYKITYSPSSSLEPGHYSDIWNNVTLSGLTSNIKFAFQIFPHHENEVTKYSRIAKSTTRVFNSKLYEYDRYRLFYDRNLLVGRNAMVHIVRGSNWYDTTAGNITNNVDSEEITLSGLIAIANVGFAFIDGPRACTKTGQSKLEIIRAFNPNFTYMAYFTYGHVPASDPGLTIPVSSWVYNNLPRVKDINGGDVRAWPDPAGNPAPTVGAFWGDYFTNPTPGYTFNKSIIEGHVNAIVSGINAATIKPNSIMWDYFNTKDSGYYVWPGEDPIDINQNGTQYSSDEAEKTAFRDAQIYFVKYAKSLLPNILMTANGRGAWPDSSELDLLKELHGSAFEQFPNTPWKDPVDTMDIIYNNYYNEKYGRFKNRPSAMHFTDVHHDVNWSTDTKVRPLSRAAALFFDIWYMYRAANSTDYTYDRIVDPDWEPLIQQLGTPSYGVTRSGNITGVHTYSRKFTGGTLVATLDGTQTGINQVISVEVV